MGGRARAMAFMSALALVMAAAFWDTASANLYQEENALLLFKGGLRDTGALESWLPQLSSSSTSSGVCSGSWRGVGCNPTRDAVVALTLEGRDFSGPIPDSIRNLTFLKDLTIRKTSFLGAIPEGIAELHNLQNLIVSSNPGLSGSFPQWVLYLPHLEMLDLSGNNLTGILLGYNSTSVKIGGPVGSVTVTVPIPVVPSFNFSVPRIPIPLVAPGNVPMPLVPPIPMSVTFPNLTNANSIVGALPPFPLDNPPLYITPTMNWTFPHLNLSAAPPVPNLRPLALLNFTPPDTLPTLPHLPTMNLSFPTLPPLPDDNPEFPGFPLQRTPNFTNPQIPNPDIPPIPSINLYPYSKNFSLSLTPIPNVNLSNSTIPSLSTHP